MAEENENRMDDDLDDSMDEDILGDLSDESDEDLMDDLMDEDMESMLDESDDADESMDLAETDDDEEPKSKPSLKEHLAVLTSHVQPLFEKIKGSKKILIAIIGGSVLFFVLVLSIFLVVFSGSDDRPASVPEPGSANITESENMHSEPEVIFEDIIELEPFERIPMKGTSTMETITIHMALELVDSRYRKQIYSTEDRIRQIVEDQVAEVTWLEMRNPDGKIRLKYSLLKRINAVFPKPAVRNVYFTFFVMQ